LRPLALILALALIAVAGCSSKPRVTPGPGQQVQAAPQASLLPPPTGQLPQVDFAYDSAGARDPFVPLCWLDAGPDLSKLRIEGVVLAGSGSYAVVNDLVVTVGDQLAGCTVMGIDEDGISLDYDGEQFFVAATSGDE